MSTPLFFLLAVLAIFLITDTIYRRRVVARYFAGLNNELAERQRKHKRGWEAVGRGLDWLLQYARNNQLATQYSRARTEYFAFGRSSYRTKPFLLSAKVSHEITNVLNVNEEMLIALLENYSSLEAISHASEDDLSSKLNIDSFAAKELKIRTAKLLEEKAM